MPRHSKLDVRALSDLVVASERVVTRSQLAQVGMSSSSMSHHVGASGRWQRLLPGVVLAHRGTPTWRERALGALRYAGPSAVLTGASALKLYGVRAVGSDSIHVLIPHERRRSSHDYAKVSRTRRIGTVKHLMDLPCTTVARATIDFARDCTKLRAIRETVAFVVQRGMCTPTELKAEIQAAARQRTAPVRIVLMEIAAGVRAVSEAKLRELLRAGRILSRCGTPRCATRTDR